MSFITSIHSAHGPFGLPIIPHQSSLLSYKAKFLHSNDGTVQLFELEQGFGSLAQKEPSKSTDVSLNGYSDASIRHLFPQLKCFVNLDDKAVGKFTNWFFLSTKSFLGSS